MWMAIVQLKTYFGLFPLLMDTQNALALQNFRGIEEWRTQALP